MLDVYKSHKNDYNNRKNNWHMVTEYTGVLVVARAFSEFLGYDYSMSNRE